MKQVFLFAVKITYCVIIAIVFAIFAERISCYHLAFVPGFFFGGISSALVFDIFETKKI